MSYLLETLGRGLPTSLRSLFSNEFVTLDGDEAHALAARTREMPTSVDLSLRLGAAHLRSLKLGDARRAFEAALTMPGGERSAALGLACVHDELGELETALKYLTMAQAHDPRNARLGYSIGLCLERTGQRDAAVAAFENVLTHSPCHQPALHRLAAIAIREQKWALAAEYYQRLADDDPGDLQTQLTLGALYLHLNKAEEACEVFRRALLVEPDVSEDMLAATDGSDAEERLDQSINTLENLLQRFPGICELHVHLGDLYLKAGRDDDAINAYETALELRPQFLEAAVKLGTQHLRQQRFPEAAAAFNKAVELNDRLMLAFVGLGVAQEKAGQSDDATATLDLAASLAPNSTLLYSEASKLEIRAELDTTDDETLDLTVNRFSALDDAEAFGFDEDQSNESADLDDDSESEENLQVDELLEQAIERHERSLAEHPQYADLQYRYGLLLRQTGDVKGAARAFRAALKINPQYVKAMIKLGICLRESAHPEEALETFQKALQIDPGTVDVHYQLGLLFAQKAQFTLAVEHFEVAVSGDQTKREFRHQLALALQNIGLVDKARETWESLGSANVGKRPRIATFE